MSDHAFTRPAGNPARGLRCAARLLLGSAVLALAVSGACLIPCAAARAEGAGPGPDWVSYSWRGVSLFAPPQWREVFRNEETFLISFTPEDEALANEGLTFAAGLDQLGFRPQDFEGEGNEVVLLGQVEISGLAVQLFEVRSPQVVILACNVIEPMPSGDWLGLAFGASPAMERTEYLPLFERMLYTVTIDRDAFADSNPPLQEDDHDQDP